MDFKRGGKLLQKIRKERGLTQEALGEMTGLSAISVSRIERGVAVPTLPTLIEFCNVLEIGADYILSEYIHATSPAQWTVLTQKLESLDADKKARAEAIIESVLDNI